MRKLVSRGLAVALGLLTFTASLGHYFVVRTIDQPVTVVESVETESAYACVDSAGAEHSRANTLDEAIAACGTIAVADGGDYQIEQVATERTVSRTATHDIRGSTDLRVNVANAQFLLVNGASGSGGSSGGSPTLHAFTGFPLDANGWTDFTAMYQTEGIYTNSRIVYVSSSGNDGTAQFYSPGDPEIGSDPFAVTGGVLPYLTLSAAYGQLRDGFGDIILLHRGDEWTTGFPTWTKSGASVTEPIIIASYGSSTTRPLIRPANGANGWSNGSSGDAVEFLIVADFEVYHSDKDPTHPDYPGSTIDNTITFSSLRATNDVLYENIYSRFGMLRVQAFGGAVSNIAVRRSSFTDSYGTVAHSQDIFLQGISGLWLEENFFDKGGWHETVSGADQTVFKHNVYIQYDNSNVTFLRNVSMRASSHGVHFRAGGTMEKNFFMQNPIASFGYSQSISATAPYSGSMSYNLVWDSRDIDAAARGYGLRLEAVDGVDVIENIIAHQVTGTGADLALGIGHFEADEVSAANVTFDGNIVYNWDVSSGATGFYFDTVNSPTYVSITFQNNIGYISQGTQVDVPSAQVGAFTVTGNQYFGVDSFSPGTDFAGWNDGSPTSTDTFADPAWTDPNRDIESYVTSIGLSPVDHEDAIDLFSTGARAQNKWLWDEDYTAIAVINYARDGYGLPAIN